MRPLLRPTSQPSASIVQSRTDEVNRSTQLGEECLGQHLGSDQEANLGDGQGNVTEIEELRWNYGNPYVGTCEETFNGGLHLRYWTQNTTGAYFLAVSVEKDLAAGHDIVVDG